MDNQSTSFLAPEAFFPLPDRFDIENYLETEREMWALFPETMGKRVNFVQIGLHSWLCVEAPETAGPLSGGEAYFLMPCENMTMSPVRMLLSRRLTLAEHRMAHLTAVKLIGKYQEATRILQSVTESILGTEVIAEIAEQLRPQA